MNNIILNILVLVILIGFTFLVISKKRKENREQSETWSEFSKKNNFQFTPYNISGNYKGLSFTIKRYDHQSYTGISVSGVLLDKDKGMIYTIIKFNIPNLPKGLQIYLRERITKTYLIPLSTQSNHPIETGDIEFDNKIVVRGESNIEVIQYLNEQRKDHLMKILPSIENASIQPYGLHMTIPSRLDDLYKLERIHTQMGDFAWEFSRS